MKKDTYEIKSKQYLSDIEPFKSLGIPTNVFLFKTIPGCGATEREITFERHSIILEVNVPVIVGKCKKSKKLLGVHEGVNTQAVVDYLLNDIQYKKLLVTPESFYKIKDAVREAGFDLHADFFLLFDECEKIIQDVNYRGNIILPIDDFFKFKNKAFVSATPIIPSDPRFEQQGFTIVEIEPTFKYSQPLFLITTNNIFSTLNKFIINNPRDKYFIFFNSTDNIFDFIRKTKIEDESMVFCAKESSKKLKFNKFNHVSTDLAKFKKYNFFTSRFYSAVDIDYETFNSIPTIIMVTDLAFALHSKIDPFTEAIQIPGRFRKPQGKSLKREIIHISNTDNDLASMKEAEVFQYLKDSHLVYREITRFFDAATSMYAKDTIRQMLERIDYARFINIDKSRNHFMVDNLIADEKVKGYYKKAEVLRQTYDQCKHFEVIKYVNESYKYTDTHRVKARRKNQPLKSLKKLLTERLIAIHKSKSKMTDFQYDMEISNLQFDFPDQMAPVNKYGIDNAIKFGFDIKAIEHELRKTKREKDYFGMMTYIQDNFQINTVYETEEIGRLLSIGMIQNKIFNVAPGVKYLRKYAHISDSQKRVFVRKDENGKAIRGYKIFGFKDNIF